MDKMEVIGLEVDLDVYQILLYSDTEVLSGFNLERA